MAKSKFKSPIKAKPLRNPGESLDKQIDEIRYDEVLSNAFVSWVMVVFALKEWHQWYYKLPPSPVFFTLLAVLVIIYSTVKIFYALKKIKNLKQGRDGEKAVGQYLESLREQGAKYSTTFPATTLTWIMS